MNKAALSVHLYVSPRGSKGSWFKSKVNFTLVSQLTQPQSIKQLFRCEEIPDHFASGGYEVPPSLLWWKLVVFFMPDNWSTLRQTASCLNILSVFLSQMFAHQFYISKLSIFSSTVLVHETVVLVCRDVWTVKRQANKSDICFDPFQKRASYSHGVCVYIYIYTHHVYI